MFGLCEDMTKINTSRLLRQFFIQQNIVPNFKIVLFQRHNTNWGQVMLLLKTSFNQSNKKYSFRLKIKNISQGR